MALQDFKALSIELLGFYALFLGMHADEMMGQLRNIITVFF